MEKDDKPTDNASAPATEEEDPELARRKARAARFGIPLVEPTKPKTSTKQQSQNKRAPKLATAEVSVAVHCHSTNLEHKSPRNKSLRF